MPTSSTLWPAILAVLAAYLYAAGWLRRRAAQRAEEARLQAIERQFPPRAIDTSPIAARLRLVRRDHAAASRQHRRSARYRLELFAAARRIVADLGYFRRNVATKGTGQ